jgi:hypothetical protein
MNKKQLKIYNWLIDNPGYARWSKNRIVEVYYNANDGELTVSTEDVEKALKLARIDLKNKGRGLASKRVKITVPVGFPLEAYHHVGKKKKQGETSKYSLAPLNKDNVLFVADLHAPHILSGYLEWCKDLQEKYNCGTVIFSGDIIDSGAWSYHEHNPDLPGVKDELYAAKEQLKKVFKLFPEAISLWGNHDLLISRKMKTAGLSQEFMKDFGQIIEAPKTWKFMHQYKKDNVLYKHGAIGDAFKAAVESRISTCQGHFHAKSFVQWSVSEKDAIFGLQVGGGFDRNKMAFDYAKPFHKKPIISCGLILDQGTTPIVKIMPL